MIETIGSTFTLFDGAALAIILLSALMALSRGFMRELAALGALMAAIAAAYFGRNLFRDQIAGLLPDGTTDRAADLIVILGAFTVVYLFARLVGGRLTRLVQGVEGVSIVDRLAGLVFGAARGGAAMVFMAWLMMNIVPSDRVPGFISDSATYPVFERAATALNANAPRIAEDIQDALPNSPTDG